MTLHLLNLKKPLATLATYLQNMFEIHLITSVSPAVTRSKQLPSLCPCWAPVSLHSVCPQTARVISLNTIRVYFPNAFPFHLQANAGSSPELQYPALTAWPKPTTERLSPSWSRLPATDQAGPYTRATPASSHHFTSQMPASLHSGHNSRSSSSESLVESSHPPVLTNVSPFQLSFRAFIAIWK